MTRTAWATWSVAWALGALWGAACAPHVPRMPARWAGPCEDGPERYATVYEDLTAGRSVRVETIQRCRVVERDRVELRVFDGLILGMGEPEHQSATLAVGPDGYGLVREVLPGCTLDHDPPLVLLPARPTRPAEWSAEVDQAEGPARRTCRLTRGSPYCERGALVTCRLTLGSEDLVTRTHFCPGLGLQGEEGVRFVHGTAAARYRTYGEVGPGDPPDQARPYPTVDAIEHPAPPPTGRRSGPTCEAHP